MVEDGVVMATFTRVTQKQMDTVAQALDRVVQQIYAGEFSYVEMTMEAESIEGPTVDCYRTWTDSGRREIVLVAQLKKTSL